MPNEQIQIPAELAWYIAEYIKYEVYDLKRPLAEISGDTVLEAVSAYNGGAR